MTVRVVTDSTADLPPDLIRELGIIVVPAYVTFGKKTYKDGVDISQEEVYQKMINENSLTATINVIEEKDILNGIMKASKDMDLILMGGRTGDFLELLLAGSLAQEITEKVNCPVLWVKEYEERKSFWTSLLKPYKNVGEQ